MEAFEFEKDWKGFRVLATTDSGVTERSGAWQFEIQATATWADSQTFMLSIVAMTIGDRRWKVTKVEEPIGNSLVWKVKAQVQKT